MGRERQKSTHLHYALNYTIHLVGGHGFSVPLPGLVPHKGQQLSKCEAHLRVSWKQIECKDNSLNRVAQFCTLPTKRMRFPSKHLATFSGEILYGLQRRGCHSRPFHLPLFSDSERISKVHIGSSLREEKRRRRGEGTKTSPSIGPKTILTLEWFWTSLAAQHSPEISTQLCSWKHGASGGLKWRKGGEGNEPHESLNSIPHNIEFLYQIIK